MRVVTYSRKSQDDPESVEDQMKAARAFCEARGHPIVQEFSDSGISGGEFAQRPGLNALLDAATAKRREFDGLVIRDVDRLGRDQFRTAMALQDITEHGVRVFCYSVNDGEEIKLGSFADKMMLSIRTGTPR